MPSSSVSSVVLSPPRMRRTRGPLEQHGYCASSTTYNAPSCIATSAGRQGGSDVARTRRDGTGEEAVEVGGHGDLGVVRAELPEAAAALVDGVDRSAGALLDVAHVAHLELADAGAFEDEEPGTSNVADEDAIVADDDAARVGVGEGGAGEEQRQEGEAVHG